MRQGPEQNPLLETISRIRCGEIIQTDWVSVNARSLYAQQSHNPMFYLECGRQTELQNIKQFRCSNSSYSCNQQW